MKNWAKICKGCGKCCGPVPFPKEFLMTHNHLYQELPVSLLFFSPNLIIPQTISLDCVFLNKIEKKCLIYEDRPEVCRLQGNMPELPCPKSENLTGD